MPPPPPPPPQLWWCPAAARLNLTAWREVSWPPLPMRSSAEVLDLSRLHTYYVRNPKAASETLMLWLVRGLGAARPRRKHLHVPYRPSARDHRYFTFVREPIDAALAGYAELSRRSLFSLSQASRARQHGWTNVTAGAREQARVVRAVPYLRIPCSRAADRLRSFLDGVEHGRPLGDQAYHVYPQAMKLAAAPRLDFIGRVEHFSDDWAALLEWLNATGRLARRRRRPIRHTTKRDPCAIAADQLDAPTLRRLCSLYAADYACLAGIYPLPGACRAPAVTVSAQQ